MIQLISGKKNIGEVKKMKIIVLGSRGMAGHMITKYLKHKKWNVTTVARSHADYCMDILDEDAQKNLLENLPKYDYVVNAQGILVKEANENPDLAMKINGEWPWKLAEAVEKSHTRIIHISTDCVFDGKKGLYFETDKPTETNAYGTSKAKGELVGTRHVTFRTSIIGPELKQGTGLFQWLQSQSSRTLDGYQNHLWNGITTYTLAKAIDKYCLVPNIVDVYHLVNNAYDYDKATLCQLISDTWGFGHIIKRVDHPKPQDKRLLNCDRDFNFDIPHMKDQLTQMYHFYCNE
jgi:dTDP-4-dehydrorhamnose reductase